MSLITRNYKIKKKDIELVLRDYNLGKLVSFKQLTQGAENVLAKIKTKKGTFVLKIFVLLKNKKYLFYEIDLLNYLAENKMPVAEVYKSKKGFVSNFKGKSVIVMKYIEGNHRYKNNEYFIKNIGTFLGKFHKLILNYKPKHYEKIPSSLSIDILYKRLTKFLKKYPLIKIKEKIKKFMPYLQKTNYENLPKGAIHNDFHQFNLLIKNNKIIGIIDFQSFYGPLIYDVASAIVRFCFNKNGSLNKQKTRIFIREYEKYREITKKEKSKMIGAIKFNILYVIDYFIPKGKKMPKWYFKELQAYIKMFEYMNKLKNYKGIIE